MSQPLLEIGEPAPDFTLPDQEGRPVHLSDYRGKQAVALIFYPGDQTPLCSAQLCEMRDSYDLLAATGIEVLGVNPFGAGSHQRFVKNKRLPFRLLVDPGGQVAQLYQAWLGLGPLGFVNRSVYVVGVDGKIHYAQRGKPTPTEILKALGVPPR